MLGYWPALLLAVELALRAVVVARVIQRGPRRSASSLAWILVVLVLPAAISTIAWFLVGEARLGSHRRAMCAILAERITLAAARAGPIEEHRAIPPDYEATIALAAAVGGTPSRSGNDLTLIADTDQAFDALIADLDAAQDHVHLLYYIFLPDATGRRVGGALMRAARRGVTCRLLVDDVGSRDFLASSLRHDIESTGVRIVAALPANLVRAALARIDLRNHRKLAVVDGRIGYTGSQNVADASFALKPRYAPWVDCTLRIEGPVVRDLQSIFVTDWFVDAQESLEELLSRPVPEIPGGVAAQVLPTGPSNDNEALAQLALAAFHRATDELILTTPYFVPGESEVASLATAARRGVSVALVLPARNDSRLVGAISRSHYRELLDAGVEIHEYQKGLLHAKTLTVDRDLALVTTANFDRRSFELNFEISVLVYDSDFASRLRFLQKSYMADSRRVKQADLPRSYVRRFVENAAGVLSPLL